MERDVVPGQNYRLVISGELDERFAYLFEGMRMERKDGQTLMTGTVRDQAQLHGFFERVEELGLELVSVQQGPSTTELVTDDPRTEDTE
jgi:hypothetical protein